MLAADLRVNHVQLPRAMQEGPVTGRELTVASLHLKFISGARGAILQVDHHRQRVMTAPVAEPA
ncbi:hypothetical protein GCM10028795_01340 [Lysobacter olei]